MPNTRFLFWNVNRKPLETQVADLAQEHRVDVVILAECVTRPAILLRALNGPQKLGGFQLSRSANSAIKIYTRFAAEFLQPAFDSDRVSIRKLVLPVRPEILLVAVHLPSKRYWSAEGQSLQCTELARTIAEVENRVGHRRTVLVGDLNMNPFESGMIGAAGLHAVMSRRIAARETRTVQERPYHFFYNPMWNHLGDRASDTAGSYYYDNAEQVNYFWNVFDQVLMRPELANGFDNDQLRILRSAGPSTLVRPDGKPNSDDFSDHLPIMFSIDF